MSNFYSLSQIAKGGTWNCANNNEWFNLNKNLYLFYFQTTNNIIKDYYNIPMHSDDIEKTAVHTWIGISFVFVVMPYGLRNAMRSLKSIFSLLHYNHLQIVLQKLKNSSLSINASKCEFCVSNTGLLD